jgi:hypothetical protein
MMNGKLRRKRLLRLKAPSLEGALELNALSERSPSNSTYVPIWYVRRKCLSCTIATTAPTNTTKAPAIAASALISSHPMG